MRPGDIIFARRRLDPLSSSPKRSLNQFCGTGGACSGRSGPLNAEPGVLGWTRKARADGHARLLAPRRTWVDNFERFRDVLVSYRTLASGV